jgi:L-fuconate dehydratase
MITGATARDIRFPTSQGLHGSDAMTPDPDYSAAYVTLTADDGLEGHGFTFTEGRGNELCVAAIEALAPRVQGLELDEVRADPGEVFRRVTGDPQLRWLGPEKGVIHLATAAVVNAVWDMWARAEGKPLWRLVADFTPSEFVAAVPFQYLTDAIDPGAARELLEERAAGKDERRAEMERDGFPAYTTSPAGSATPRRRSGGSPARRSPRAGTT